MKYAFVLDTHYGMNSICSNGLTFIDIAKCFLELLFTKLEKRAAAGTPCSLFPAPPPPRQPPQPPHITAFTKSSSFCLLTNREMLLNRIKPVAEIKLHATVPISSLLSKQGPPAPVWTTLAALKDRVKNILACDFILLDELLFGRGEAKSLSTDLFQFVESHHSILASASSGPASKGIACDLENTCIVVLSYNETDVAFLHDRPSFPSSSSPPSSFGLPYVTSMPPAWRVFSIMLSSTDTAPPRDVDDGPSPKCSLLLELCQSTGGSCTFVTGVKQMTRSVDALLDDMCAFAGMGQPSKKDKGLLEKLEKSHSLVSLSAGASTGEDRDGSVINHATDGADGGPPQKSMMQSISSMFAFGKIVKGKAEGNEGNAAKTPTLSPSTGVSVSWSSSSSSSSSLSKLGSIGPTGSTSAVTCAYCERKIQTIHMENHLKKCKPAKGATKKATAVLKGGSPRYDRLMFGLSQMIPERFYREGYSKRKAGSAGLPGVLSDIDDERAAKVPSRVAKSLSTQVFVEKDRITASPAQSVVVGVNSPLVHVASTAYFSGAEEPEKCGCASCAKGGGSPRNPLVEGKVSLGRKKREKAPQSRQCMDLFVAAGRSKDTETCLRLLRGNDHMDGGPISWRTRKQPGHSWYDVDDDDDKRSSSSMNEDGDDLEEAVGVDVDVGVNMDVYVDVTSKTDSSTGGTAATVKVDKDGKGSIGSELTIDRKGVEAAEDSESVRGNLVRFHTFFREAMRDEMLLSRAPDEPAFQTSAGMQKDGRDKEKYTGKGKIETLLVLAERVLTAMEVHLLHKGPRSVSVRPQLSSSASIASGSASILSRFPPFPLSPPCSQSLLDMQGAFLTQGATAAREFDQMEVSSHLQAWADHLLQQKQALGQEQHRQARC